MNRTAAIVGAAVLGMLVAGGVMWRLGSSPSGVSDVHAVAKVLDAAPARPRLALTFPGRALSVKAILGHSRSDVAKHIGSKPRAGAVDAVDEYDVDGWIVDVRFDDAKASWIWVLPNVDAEPAELATARADIEAWLGFDPLDPTMESEIVEDLGVPRIWSAAALAELRGLEESARVQMEILRAKRGPVVNGLNAALAAIDKELSQGVTLVASVDGDDLVITPSEAGACSLEVLRAIRDTVSIDLSQFFLLMRCADGVALKF